MNPINTNSSLRRFQVFGFLSVLVMVGVVGGWATFSELNGAVIAPATIMVESYSKKVQHKEGGIVGDIRVKDGDRVEIGQALVILDNTETKSELAIIDGLLDEALAKRARLEAQRDRASAIIFPAEVIARANEPGVAAIMAGQTKLFNARLQAIIGKKEQLNQQIGQLTEQIGGLESQKVAKEKQLVLISAELTDLKDLQSKGLVPISRVLAMDRETARLDGERGELVASKASAEARIAEVKVQILQIDEEDMSQTLTDLRDIEGKVAELKERKLAIASRLERMVIKSPITGDVYQLAVHTVGGVIGPGEPIMLIVPEADELILQAQVMPQDIDQGAARPDCPHPFSRVQFQTDARGCRRGDADFRRYKPDRREFAALLFGAPDDLGQGARQARHEQAQARHAGGSLYPDRSADAADLFPETTHRPVRSRVTRRLTPRFLLKPAPATEF